MLNKGRDTKKIRSNLEIFSCFTETIETMSRVVLHTKLFVSAFKKFLFLTGAGTGWPLKDK